MTKIKEAKNSVIMCTNAGEKKMNEVGEILGIDEKCWADKESMANVVAFKNLSDRDCLRRVNERNSSKEKYDDIRNCKHKC